MIGTVLGTRYRILELLGEGSMGQVYLAQHLDLGRHEAIKVLQPVVAIDPTFVRRFRREARATNRVQHPNIVSVYDFGQLPDGRLFLAMEYADGTPLDKLLRGQGALPVDRALHVLHQLASAVGHAHERGVVHRDLKPSNMILIEHRGHADVLKVLDFGIAKIIAPDYQESVNLTRDGEIFGTAEYMAPELFLDKAVDLRSDIYAMGCIGFELLTGEPPFRGRLIELIHAHSKQVPPPPSERQPRAGIPTELDSVISSCLAKDPAARYQSATSLMAALERIRGFPHKRPTASRLSKSSFARPTAHHVPAQQTLESAQTAAAAGPGSASEVTAPIIDLATADTAFMCQSELVASVRESLRDLAEGLLDHGVDDTHITDLTVAVANLIAIEDDIARLDGESRRYDEAEARTEQATREREGPLRFAIGELRFDADLATDDARADLTYQISALETRLKALLRDSRQQLDNITDHKIDVTAERADVEERQALAYHHLQQLVDSLVPTFDSDLAVAPLIDHYLTLRELTTS